MSEGADEALVSEFELAPAEVADLAAAGKIELVDVRLDYEHEAGHLAGSRWIEMNDLAANAASIAKDRPVVFYCRSGNRSGMAAEAFAQAGYDAHNLAGGIIAWVEEGHPLEPEDGEVAGPRPT
jgi:rhodanese-related sulfurtransferase